MRDVFPPVTHRCRLPFSLLSSGLPESEAASCESLIASILGRPLAASKSFGAAVATKTETEKVVAVIFMRWVLGADWWWARTRLPKGRCSSFLRAWCGDCSLTSGTLLLVPSRTALLPSVRRGCPCFFPAISPQTVAALFCCAPCGEESPREWLSRQTALSLHHSCLKMGRAIRAHSLASVER